MGNIYDFAGSYTINKGFLAFGRPMLIWKYDNVQNKDKWDNSIEMANQEFLSKTHRILSNNCYDHICQFLNDYEETDDWTRLTLWVRLATRAKTIRYSHHE
jgi:hypothetical protein